MRQGTNAAYQGHEAVAKILLAAGADKTKKTPMGTAAKMAEEKGHIALAKLLR